jgi:hypothetical protein
MTFSGELEKAAETPTSLEPDEGGLPPHPLSSLKAKEDIS